MRPKTSVLVMAALCRLSPANARRWPRIENQRAPHRGDPSFRRERAVLRTTQILLQRRRDAEEGILGILGILPRRAEIRVSQGLTRRHEATKKIRCRNGSPLPFQSDPPITQIEKNGRGGSPSGPKPQAQTRRLPQPKSSRKGAGTQRGEFWEYSGFCHAALRYQ